MDTFLQLVDQVNAGETWSRHVWVTGTVCALGEDRCTLAHRRWSHDHRGSRIITRVCVCVCFHVCVCVYAMRSVQQ